TGSNNADFHGVSTRLPQRTFRLNYFGVVTASVGMLLFLPQIVKQLGLTNMQVGWVTMIPYLCAVVAMLTWGWVSDRLGGGRLNVSGAGLVSGGGLRFTPPQ